MAVKKPSSRPPSKQKVGKSTLTKAPLPLPPHRFPARKPPVTAPPSIPAHIPEDQKVRPIPCDFALPDGGGAIICGGTIWENLKRVEGFFPVSNVTLKKEAMTYVGSLKGNWLVFFSPYALNDHAEFWPSTIPESRTGFYVDTQGNLLCVSYDVARTLKVRPLDEDQLRDIANIPAGKPLPKIITRVNRKKLKALAPNPNGFVSLLVQASNQVWDEMRKKKGGWPEDLYPIQAEHMDKPVPIVKLDFKSCPIKRRRRKIKGK